MKGAIIKIEHLCLRLANQQILDNIYLQVEAGDYISIIGPNGAGKTSLLKCLLRIYSISAGRIFFHGVPLSNFAQKDLAKQISYVPQSNETIFPFTVEEFVMMGRYPFLNPFSSLKATDKKAVQEAMALCDVSHNVNRLMKTLSGGERQVVYIAAALAQGSDILLLDEPTTFLDPNYQSKIYRLLKRLNTELGKTIILVTHDINSAVLQGERVIVLKQGKILFDGDGKKIMDNKLLKNAYDKEFDFTIHPFTGQKIILPEVLA